jgi:hypothetical protein
MEKTVLIEIRKRNLSGINPMLNIHQIGSNKVKYLQSKMSHPQRG